MILVVILVLGLLLLSALSLQLTRVHGITQTTQQDVFLAKQIAESGAAQAIARIKRGGFKEPASGGGPSPQWVNFSPGQFYYYTTADGANGVSVIRAWGRLAADPDPSTSTAAPDAADWSGNGWLVKGIEITLKSSKYIPQGPLFFGNGGIERPLGGFEWTGGTDLTDPSTWGITSSGPSSYQSSSLPFEVSALDYPADFLSAGGVPAPAVVGRHPYKIWTSQNPIGQFNVKAWFANSAGAGYTPTLKVTPAPTSTYYDVADAASADYPYPVDPNVPDVQTFAWELWTKYQDVAGAAKLSAGSHSGTYGTLSAPAVTFVTGALRVPAGSTFRGTGILVIRDDFDPNTQADNRPGDRADLDVRGTFEWTGLVIMAGWAPDIDVADEAGASATIVGALFGEDSVQSGGEISLDSATIITRIKKSFRVLYSNKLFSPGGLIHDLLPSVNQEIVGIREI